MTRAQSLGGFALCVVAGGALGWAAGGATVPQLWVSYALPGDLKPRPAAPAVIDAPLTFTPDSAGRMHLGVSLPLVGLLASGCTADAAGNLTCPKLSFAPPPLPAQVVYVTDETPAPGATAGTWVLAHPIADPSHAFCAVDGAVQSGFVIAGNIITASWDASKPIKCSYGYLP